jgi:hypothetical protein
VGIRLRMFKRPYNSGVRSFGLIKAVKIPKTCIYTLLEEYLNILFVIESFRLLAIMNLKRDKR